MFGFSLNPIDWVTDAAGSLLGVVGEGVMDSIAGAFEEALSWFGKQLADAVTSLGAGDFESGAFAATASMFWYIAVALIVGTTMLSVAGAVMSKRVELDEVLREIPITLVMMASWGAVCSIWFTLCRQLTSWALSDTLTEAFSAGLSLDAGIASVFRLLIAAVMLIALIVFAVEMVFIKFLGPFAVALGPVSLAMRPWPSMRDVAKRMVMNLALLTLTPFMVAASMSFAMRNINEAGVLGWLQALTGMCGMLVSVLMPAMLKRYLPLDGQGGSAGRAMMAAAAAITGAAATIVATGGAAAAAAPAAAGAGGGQLAALSSGGGAIGGAATGLSLSGAAQAPSASGTGATSNSPASSLSTGDRESSAGTSSGGDKSAAQTHPDPTPVGVTEAGGSSSRGSSLSQGQVAAMAADRALSALSRGEEQ